MLFYQNNCEDSIHFLRDNDLDNEFFWDLNPSDDQFNTIFKITNYGRRINLINAINEIKKKAKKTD